MARATVTTTGTMEQIATGVAVFDIIKRGSGALLLNETASDTDASPFGVDVRPGDQLQQFSDVNTFARHTGAGDGWVLLIDGAAIPDIPVNAVTVDTVVIFVDGFPITVT